MASTTDNALRTQVMYQVFVRDFSPEGTFDALRSQLDRIHALGADIIWLMPIHPIGETNRKGTLGSPYAIRDYRGINPEFGTLSDFQALVEDIHARGMKCIIDVVYNHTSPDSVLFREHPDWFYRREDGTPGNRIGDWTDVIDLDYSNRALWDYQIETLKYWAGMVDGFRCDVAPLVPLAFWQEARREVETVRPGCIWLAESVEPRFIRHIRGRGMTALSDSEVFQAFDICYDYDIYWDWRAALDGSGTLQAYADAVERQEYIYPGNYVKLRFLENHDQTRARFLAPDIRALKNQTAFLFFQKGMALVYAGQERGVSHLPSLFEKDDVPWDAPENIDLSAFMRRLSDIKRHEIFAGGAYSLQAVGERFLVGHYRRDKHEALGVFSLRGEAGYVPVDFEDGSYVNLIDGSPAEVFRGGIASLGEPIILIK